MGSLQEICVVVYVNTENIYSVFSDQPNNVNISHLSYLQLRTHSAGRLVKGVAGQMRRGVHVQQDSNISLSQQ